MAARGTGKTISQLFSRLTPFPGNLWILLRGRGKKLYDEYCDHMMEAWRFLQSAITVGLDLLREFQAVFWHSFVCVLRLLINLPDDKMFRWLRKSYWM